MCSFFVTFLSLILETLAKYFRALLFGAPGIIYLPKLKTRVAIVNEMVTDIAVVKDRGRQWW